MSRGSRENLLLTVDRDNPSQKIAGLIAKAPDLIDEMSLNEGLSSQLIEITPKRMALLKDFSTFIAFLINAIMLFFYKRQHHYRNPRIPQYIEDSIQYLGIVQGFSSGILILFYSINRASLIIKSRWRSFCEQNKKKLTLPSNEDRLDVTEMSIEMTHRILLLNGPDATEFTIEGKRRFGNCFTTMEYYLFNIWFFLSDPQFRFYVFYFGTSMVGFIYGPIFYSLHLLDVVNRFSTLKNVIRSVTSNLKQLVMTFILITTIIFIYASIGFFYL